MFRSRLLLRLERTIEAGMNDPMVLYETLKVYLMLGGKAPKVDDELVVTWMRKDWEENRYPGPQQPRRARGARKASARHAGARRRSTSRPSTSTAAGRIGAALAGAHEHGGPRLGADQDGRLRGAARAIFRCRRVAGRMRRWCSRRSTAANSTSSACPASTPMPASRTSTSPSSPRSPRKSSTTNG